VEGNAVRARYGAGALSRVWGLWHPAVKSAPHRLVPRESRWLLLPAYPTTSTSARLCSRSLAR
jgi:hypothetical protein